MTGDVGIGLGLAGGVKLVEQVLMGVDEVAAEVCHGRYRGDADEGPVQQESVDRGGRGGLVRVSWTMPANDGRIAAVTVVL